MRHSGRIPSAGLRLEIGLLGPLEVTSDGVLVSVGPARERAVLSVLALRPGRRVPVDDLVAALWGDEPPTTASKTLQTYISHLRRMLPTGAIGTVTGGYLIDIGADAVDALRFEHLAKQSRRALEKGHSAAAAEGLREAIALWRGDAVVELAGQAPGRAEAVRLTEMLLGAEDDLAEARLDLGDHTALIPDLERAVATKPLREHRWAQLMLALYRSGRQAEALEAYRRARSHLVEALGIEPGAELRGMERAVLRQEAWLQPRGSGVASQTSDGDSEHEISNRVSALSDRRPFVGRQVELAELRALTDRAQAGHGSVVMIGGEPGVGKTRLTQEVASEARRCFQVFVGHCYEGEGNLPYMPWVEMVESLIGDLTPELLGEALGDEAPEFARLVPQIRRVLPATPPPLELPPEQQRRHTFNSLRAYLTRASRMRSRLYILEDLHWADESTLLLLEYLAEHVSTIPCLIVGTYRDTPVDVSPRLAATLSTLVRQRQARLMSVRHHSEPEVEVLLQVLSGGHTPPRAVTEAFYAETEGNAFFVEEVFRHLVETGRLLDSDGYLDNLRIQELDVPPNVRLVVGQRLDRLDESTRQVLTGGAVIGRHFELAPLRAVVEMDETILIDGLEEAEQARLIVSERSGVRERYWFAHELIRQTLLSTLSTARRRRYHLRVADALERVYVADPERHAADLAFHLWEAGEAADRSRTARWLRVAGEQSLTAAAFEEALRSYENALSVLPPHQTHERAEILLNIGRAQRSLGRWDLALTTSDEAFPLLEAIRDVDALGALCWEDGAHLNWSFRSAEALAVANRGLIAIGDQSATARARVLAIRALAHSTAGEHDAAGVDLAEARELAETAHDVDVLSNVWFVEGAHHYMFMTLPEAVDPCRRAAEQLRKVGAGYRLAEALAYLDLAYVFQGRLHESNEIYDELEKLLARVGHHGAAWSGRRNRFASLAAQTADLVALERLSDAQWFAASETGVRGWTAYAHVLRGILAFWQGDWESSRIAMEEGVRLSEPGLWWFGANHGFLLMVLAFAGDRARAYSVLQEVWDTLPRAGRANTIGAWCLASLAAEAAAALKDRALAETLYPLTLAALETGTLMRFYEGALLQRCAGMVAGAAGRHTSAEEHFEAALEQSEDLPHLLERPQVRHQYGRYLMERGGRDDADRAQRLIGEGLLEYRRIGMPRHEAMALDLLSGLG